MPLICLKKNQRNKQNKNTKSFFSLVIQKESKQTLHAHFANKTEDFTTNQNTLSSN